MIKLQRHNILEFDATRKSVVSKIGVLYPIKNQNL